MGRMEASPPHTLAQPGELGQPSFLGLLTPHLLLCFVPCSEERETKEGEKEAA